MKLTFIALILFTQGLFAVDINSQTSLVTISMENVDAGKIIEEIEAQTDYLFLYDWEEVNLNRKVTVQAKKQSVAEILTTVFRNTDIVYAVEGNSIFLMKKEKGIDVPTIMQQQKRTINGIIADNNGEPVIGANVVEKGTTNGVITDIDGNFSISVAENAILQVSYIGYVSQEAKVGNQTYVSILLQEDTQTLEEVVVVGYGTQKKANLSGAVEAVSAKRLESRSTNNVGLALQGIVPSLTIQPGNGQVNSTPSYNIRGMTSINGGSPLIMVDGVPTDPADFSRMNAADIENISVLKDASSAAIYGARAAFGVILVTTRKGDTDKLTVRFNNVFNMRKLGRMPDVVTDPYINASYREIMGAPWYHYYDEPTLEYAKELSENPSLPNIIMDPLQPERWLYFCNTDWYKEVYGSGLASSNSHNINISGKGGKVSYYLGAEYYKERGVIKINRDEYDKFNLRSHVEYKPTDWLTIGNNTSLQYYIYEMPTHLNSTFFWNMSYRAKSLYPVRNPDGTWADGTIGAAASTNLIAELQDGGNTKTNQYVTQTQFDMDIALIKNVWHIKGDFTAKYSNNKTNAWANYTTTRHGPDLPLINFDMSYYGWDEYTQLSTWNKLYTMGNVYTDFNKTWGKHSLSALLGFSQEYERYESFTGRRKNMITPTYPTPQLAAGAMTLTEDVYEWSIRSAFFRLNYIFNNRYIFEANGRYDGTSRFPKNDRFGFFPSVSGAWLISEEAFFTPLKEWLNYSKIRLSYGSLGNQDVNYYQYIATMNAVKIGQLIDADQPMGIYSPGLVSHNLTWEKISTFDVGLDLNFLSNRLTFSGDVFRRTTKDMLSKGKTLPSVLGTSEPKINAADLVSKGWEVSLAWNDKLNIGSKPLNYNARFILSDSRAFIKRFDNPTKYLGDYYEGQQVGEIWGLVTEGFFTSQDDIDSHANQVEVTSYPGDRPIEPGDLKYKDLNGDGEINRGSWTVDDPGDYKVIGNNSIRYNFGLDLGGDWNGWDLRLLFQGVGKRDLYPDAGPAFWGIYYAPDAYILKETLDHWTPENPNAYLPRLKSYLTTNDLGIPQTRYLQNAAYVRMKNITLGYTLPESLLKSKLGIRVYFSGENLFEITSLRNPLDPEAEGSNIHPFQRSYSFGLNITL